MSLIYAAGPIAGQTYEGAADWRLQLAESVKPHQVMTPMRGKEYLEQLPSMPLTSAELMPGDGTVATISALDREISSERAIYRRDTWDVHRCDLVFANFLPNDAVGKVSVGTVCEVFLAGHLRKPVVAVLEKNGVHDHPFITGSSWITVDNLPDALHAVRIAFHLV